MASAPSLNAATNVRPAAVPKVRRLHRLCLWLAALSLLVWVGSGLLHPLMGVLGPRPQAFMPPPLAIDGAALAQGLPALLPQLEGAGLARVVPSAAGPLWQITAPQTLQRRYLQLDGSPASLTDAGQAQWLGEHYTGRSALAAPPRLITEFDADYPAVNRLLPVWRLEYSGPEQQVAYVHTETGVLTGYVDPRKRAMQTAFRQLHTLAFLDALPLAQRVLSGLAMLSVLVMAVTGLLLARQRGGAQPVRRWHRRLGWIVLLPVLLMAGSGLLHAWFAPALRASELRLPPPLQTAAAREAAAVTLPAALQAAALRPGANGALWLVWQASAVAPTVAAAAHHGPAAPATSALEGLALDGSARPLTLAELGASAAALHVAEADAGRPLFGFDPDYDFRNRRLPAWQIHEPASGDLLSFDPLTAVQIDRAAGATRFEAWAFAWLHKWNPLSAPLGRFGRDALQALWLLLALGVAGLGLWIRLRRPRRSAPAASPAPRGV